MTLWLPLALFELWTSFKIIATTCDCISAGSLFATENKKQFRLANADFWLNDITIGLKLFTLKYIL